MAKNHKTNQWKSSKTNWKSSKTTELASNHAFFADKFLWESILLLFLRGLNFLFLKCTSHVPHTLKSISKFLKIYMTNFTDRSIVIWYWLFHSKGYSTVLHQELLPLSQQVVLLDFFQSLLLDGPAAFRRDWLWAYKVALPKNWSRKYRITSHRSHRDRLKRT